MAEIKDIINKFQHPSPKYLTNEEQDKLYEALELAKRVEENREELELLLQRCRVFFSIASSSRLEKTSLENLGMDISASAERSVARILEDE